MGKVALPGRKGCPDHEAGDVLDPMCKGCSKFTRAHTNGRFSSAISKMFEVRDMGAFRRVFVAVEKSNGDIEGVSIGERGFVKDMLQKVIDTDALSYEPSPPIIIGKFADKGTREKARFSIRNPDNEEQKVKRRRVREKTQNPVYLLQDICFTFSPVNSFEDLNRFVNRYSRGAV